MKKVSSLSRLRVHPKLGQYYPLCWKYLYYLHDKEHIQILIEGFNRRKEIIDEVYKPYMHRWKPEYMKARIAKFYLLDAWAKTHPFPLSMLTFTTYHDSAYARRINRQGYTINESWEILKTGFRKASLLIRNKIRNGVPYFWIVEPQTGIRLSSYPCKIFHGIYRYRKGPDEKSLVKYSEGRGLQTWAGLFIRP